MYGLFRTKSSDEYALLVVQCKDWFKSPDHDIYKMENKWQHSKIVFPDPVIQLSIEGTETRDFVVRVVHLLVTSNEMAEMLMPIEENAGIITFESMRSWNPTAAYALECASGLRKLYCELPQTDED